MNKKKLTVKQHYVPQVYLRGFAVEYLPLHKSNIPKDEHTIFSYDLASRKYDSNTSVPIKSICHKKNLYEIYNADEKILFPNWLEEFFHALEVMYGDFRDSLEAKVNRENIGCHHFLSRKERTFWITYIAIHLLRNYYALSAAEEAVRAICGNDVKDKDIKNFVRKYCLPFLGEIKDDSEYVDILSGILSPMYTMQFAVGVDLDNRLITSDKGVSIISESFPVEEYTEVIFPITSSICLFLFGQDNKDVHGDNTLFELTQSGKKHVISNVVIDAYRKIYSNHRFTLEDKRFIKEQIKDRLK